MIVMKFGGTSIEDAAAMRNVIRIVKSHLKDQPVLVISAIARATNELEQISRTAALGNESQAKELVASLFRRHSGIIDQLLTDETRKSSLKSVVDRYNDDLGRLVWKLSVTRNNTAEFTDAICSFGERLSSRILSDALSEAGVAAAWIDVKEFMQTDANFGRARPVTAKIRASLDQKIPPLLADGQVPVTQGFIGVTEDGRYTTMGRESSDYSATVIGAGLRAEKVQIWTDVDGVLTADPRVVPTARKIKRLSFAEAFRLSHFGAKVLHPATILPLIEARLPLQIMNSKKDGGNGTLVDETTLPAKGGVKSIAHKRGLSLLTVRSHSGNQAFLHEIMGIVARELSSLLFHSVSETSAVFLVEQRMVSDLTKALEPAGTVNVSEGRGSLCLVGDNIMATGVAKKIFDTLGNLEVSLVHGSENSYTIAISADKLNEAVRALHQVFLEKIEDTEVFESVTD